MKIKTLIIYLLIMIGILCGCDKISTGQSGETMQYSENRYSSYQAALSGAPFADMLEYFGKGKTIERQSQIEISDLWEYPSESIRFSDGSEISQAAWGVGYYADKWNQYPDIFRYWDQLAGYPGGAEFLFPEEDLTGMSINEAKESIQECLNALSLNVENADNWEVRCLNAEGLSWMMHELIPDNYEETRIAQGLEPSKREFSRDEEIYAIRIQMIVDSHPVVNVDLTELFTGEYRIQGTGIVAYIGQSGIVRLSVEACYVLQKEISSDLIITEESAYQVLINSAYANAVGRTIKEINSLGCCYAPLVIRQMDKEGYTFIPVYWYAVTLENGTVENVFVNAVTGKMV